MSEQHPWDAAFPEDTEPHTVAQTVTQVCREVADRVPLPPDLVESYQRLVSASADRELSEAEVAELRRVSDALDAAEANTPFARAVIGRAEENRRSITAALAELRASALVAMAMDDAPRDPRDPRDHRAQLAALDATLAMFTTSPTGAQRGELMIVGGPTARAPRTSGRLLRTNRARAPKPTKGSAVRRLDARQQQLLAHMVVRDNLAMFSLDQRIDDWATLKKVMTTLGGTWKRGKPGGFLFPADVDGAEVVRLAQTTGEIFDPKLVGFFPTPDALADPVVAMIDIPDGAVVLEPSAGNGALVRAILRAQPSAEVRCYELLKDNARQLDEEDVLVTRADFLTVAPVGRAFDAVVMNPPFADGADVAHVTHAFGFVKSGGALVAIMSAGVLYRQDRAHMAFRARVAELGGRFEENPEGAFKESGTMVRTVTLVVERMP